MTKSRPATVIALTAALTGCHFIKVNGKPLGGGSASSPSSASSSASSSSSSAEGTSGSEAAEATPAAAASQPTNTDGGSTRGTNAALCTELNIYSSTSDYSPADFADLETDENHIGSVAGKFANMMCTRGKVTDRDKIMATRASWMTKVGLDEKDFNYVAGARGYDSQDETQIPGPLGQVGRNSTLLELDQLGARASMFSRYSWAEDCLMISGGTTLMKQVLCTRERLDPAKAYAEIDSVKKVNLGTRYSLRRRVKITNDEVVRLRAKLAAQAKEEPGLAKVIAIADGVFKEWDSPSPARTKLIDQLAAMEAATKANKFSGFEGCEDKTRAAWEQHLARLKLPKVPSDAALATFLDATMDSTEGYLAYRAWRLCTAGTAGFSRQRLEIFGAESERRGPRTATIAAWIAAADTKFDDRSMSMGGLLHASGLPVMAASNIDRQRQGVIGTVGKPKDGTVEITFKDVVEPREACLKERVTNRIVMLDSNGAPIYRRECLKWGMVNMNLTADPLVIDAGMAHGLRPGMFLVGIDSVAIVATARAKSATPTWVFGGTVK